MKLDDNYHFNEFLTESNKIMVSDNFKLSEFSCPCCGIAYISKELINRLQQIRNYYGKPLIITSGFRCETHNIKVGGKEFSQHLYGNAVDFIIEGISPKEIQKYCENLFKDGGIGYGKTFTHVDVRGKRARWNY